VSYRIIKSRRMRWAGRVARMGEKRNAYRLLVGKPEEKRPLGRPRRRWVDNIKIGLLELSWGGVDWIGLAQDRDKWRALVNAVMNLWVTLNAGRGQPDGNLRPYSRFSRPVSLLFLSSSSSIVLTRLSGPRYRPTFQKIW
jgi:hypothetical protein